jgi:thioredoxin reductase
VSACPEEGVLELVHGQAAVVRGARCVGHAACERECPVGAIAVTLVDPENREDVPALTNELEAVGAPGLFLAGEVTAQALIATAVEQGTSVASEVARRVYANGYPSEADELDLCVVGAGPAGLACSLEAKRQGLVFATLDREAAVGGTVARYPRRKLVVTRPLELPLLGPLPQTEYVKEELIDLWQGIADEEQLPILGGEELREVVPLQGGGYAVHTTMGVHHARNVCLALGRRGVPRRLGVPGEELPKVAYGLLDAGSYAGRSVLVVGGGDSAVEAALVLARQPGADVTLSYRREGFFRLRARTEERLTEELPRGRIRLLFRSEVRAISQDFVELLVHTPSGAEIQALPNDDVIVLAGGDPPFELLRSAGVSFDPSLRDSAPPVEEQGTGLLHAARAGFALALVASAFALANAGYYSLPAVERPTHELHELLRPGRGLGLALGVAAVLLVFANLAYLLRRAPRFPLRFGSLRAWMTSHVLTGVLALLCAALHAAMAPRDSAGGHAFWALAVLLVTGAIGRYLYAYVPRAANGRELLLAEVKARLGPGAADEDGTASLGERRFRARAREQVGALVDERQWRRGFLGRALALIGVERALSRALARLVREGRREGVAPERIRETLGLARRVHREALVAAHCEDLRALASTWRYLHRWLSLLMVLLVAVHVVTALIYGEVFRGGVG